MSAADNSFDSKAHLHLPDGMNYACLKCGRGCEDFEEIDIDPATVERLEHLAWRDLIQDKKSGAPPEYPSVPNPYSPGDLILRKIGPQRGQRACYFLTENKLCSIHCAHGEEAKPLACRSFPYGFTETPGGTYTGLSFACTAVLQNHGTPVAENRDEAEQTREFSRNKRTAAPEILLAPGLPLTWEQYLAVEKDLDDLLEIQNVGIGQRLIAQSVYLQLLTKFLREVRGTAQAEWSADADLNEKPLATFRRNMKGDSASREWERLLRIAERPSNSRLLRRVFLGFALAFRNAYGVKLGRVGTALYITGTYMRHALGMGTIDTPRLRNPLAYRDLLKVKFDPNLPEHEALLRRFFRHCLFRKDLLIQEEIGFAHSMTLMHYGLIHWYASAFAAAEGRKEVALEDLREGVRTVEQYFVFHSKFSRLFTDHPKLKGVMEGMFHRPLYAFAMAKPETEG